MESLHTREVRFLRCRTWYMHVTSSFFVYWYQGRILALQYCHTGEWLAMQEPHVLRNFRDAAIVRPVLKERNEVGQLLINPVSASLTLRMFKSNIPWFASYQAVVRFGVIDSPVLSALHQDEQILDNGAIVFALFYSTTWVPLLYKFRGRSVRDYARR